jgi:thiosulfate/3-mercaptopyruvate sulfurtransferase
MGRPTDQLPVRLTGLRAMNRRRFLRAVVGVTGPTALVGMAGCGASVAEPVPAATVASFPGNVAPPLLIDAARFAADRAGSALPLVVDLSPLRVHRAGHVPGAVHGWWQDTMDPYYEVYGVVLKTREEPFTHPTVLGSLGIDGNRPVIFYDDDRNRYAARLVWYLRYLGLSVGAVLDGGLAAWRGAGGEVEEGKREPPDVSPPPIDGQGGIIGTRELAERLGDPTLTILDARSAEEAADDLNGTLRLGRVPGAIRLPWTATLRDDAGRLKSPEELAALYANAAVLPDREIAIVARFGVETGQPWLVLTLLGYPRVRVYDQGWAEWGAETSDLPLEPLGEVATG